MQVVVARMGEQPDFQHSIPNAFMAARPGENFLLFFAKHIKKVTHSPIKISRGLCRGVGGGGAFHAGQVILCFQIPIIMLFTAKLTAGCADCCETVRFG